MLEMNLRFNTIEELNAWFDHVCTRCAMCNADNGRADPCEVCKAEKIYENKLKELKEE